MGETGPRALIATGPWRERIRWAAKLALPWGLVWRLDIRSRQKVLRELDKDVVLDTPPADSRAEEAIRFLVARGLDEGQVRDGSMPAAALEYVAEVVSGRLPADRPVIALHVGNFVGVSLCHLSWLARERHPDSVVVSIDPNAPHRGVEDPQAHVMALLHHFGLLGNNVIVPGYSLDHSFGEAAAEKTEDFYLSGLACEGVLSSLERIGARRFDLVLLDGNHTQDYLAREFAAVRRLLADGGIVVFDDVSPADWDSVVAVFQQALEQEDVEELGQNGRVGVLRTA